MSESEPAAAPADPALRIESEMDDELSALRANGSPPGRHVPNPVFRHEQAEGTSIDGAEATLTAAKVSGELAAEADQERLRIEAEAARIDRARPGSPEAADADAAVSEAGRDADQAIAESLDSDAAADDARTATGSTFLHRGSDPAEVTADRERALADESVAGRDLAALDALEARIESDGSGLPPATS
jgi:hypothetical protein